MIALNFFKKIPDIVWVFIIFMAMLFAWNCERQKAQTYQERYETITQAYENNQEALKDSISTYKTKNNRMVSTIRSLEADKTTLQMIVETEMPELKEQLKELNIDYKQIQSLVRTQGRLLAQFEPKVSRIDSIYLYQGDTGQLYSLDFRDSTWIEFQAKLPIVNCKPLDEVDVHFSAELPVDEIIYWDRKRWFGWSWTPKWFGKVYHESQISTANPYFEITDIQSIIKRK